MDTGERVDSGWPIPHAAGCMMHDTLHITHCTTNASLAPFRASPSPLSCSVAFGVAPFVLASGLPRCWWVCGVVGLGGGGGLLDTGSGPWSFPLWGPMLALPVKV